MRELKLHAKHPGIPEIGYCGRKQAWKGWGINSKRKYMYTQYDFRATCKLCLRIAKTYPKEKPKTITIEELGRLSFLNSRRLPKVVNHLGQRKRWVGIGWVTEGPANGSEVMVTG